MEINNDLTLRAPRLRYRILPENTQVMEMIFDEESSDESDFYNQNSNCNSIIFGNSNGSWRGKIIFHAKVNAQFGRM